MIKCELIVNPTRAVLHPKSKSKFDDFRACSESDGPTGREIRKSDTIFRGLAFPDLTVIVERCCSCESNGKKSLGYNAYFDL